MRPAIACSFVLLLCLVYAVLRYLVFGDVAPANLGAYITNKAVSLTGLVLLVLAVGARLVSGVAPGLGWLREDRRALGMAGLAFSAVHTILSLLLLGPGYFGKFYDGTTGRMHAAAEWSMLAGAVALALMVWQSRVAEAGPNGVGVRASTHRRRLGTGVLALAFVHVALMGWPGWLKPADWPGGMPPITLLSAVVALAGVVLGLLPRRP